MFSACDELSRYVRSTIDRAGILWSDIVQCSLAHQLLPPHEWTKPEEVRYAGNHRESAFNVARPLRLKSQWLIGNLQDTAYLKPLIDAIEAEKKERNDLETMQITKPKSK